MRTILATLSAAALLAGCNMLPMTNNNSGGNMAAGNGAAPAGSGGGNTLAPAGNMMMPGGGAAAPGNGMAPPRGGQSREALMADCTGGAPGNVPQGTDVNQLCTCAVERVMGGSRQREAILQCADEQGVDIQGRE